MLKIAKFNTFKVIRKHSLQKPVSKKLRQRKCKFTEANLKNAKLEPGETTKGFKTSGAIELSQNAPNSPSPSLFALAQFW